MLIENSQQDIIIDLPQEVTTVGLKISGGADSSITGYMLSKYVKEERPDIKIIPVTIDQVGKAFQVKFAKRIIKYFKQEFGDIFLNHVTGISNDEMAEYASTQQEIMDRLYDENKIQKHFVGLTKNPDPKDIKGIEDGCYEPPDRIRQTELKSTVAGNCYRPFINIDKKGVAEVYNKLGLMDTLFPLTRSCEEYTDNFDSHCGKCWFCAERFYGFGRLD